MLTPTGVPQHPLEEGTLVFVSLTVHLSRSHPAPPPPGRERPVPVALHQCCEPIIHNHFRSKDCFTHGGKLTGEAYRDSVIESQVWRPSAGVRGNTQLHVVESFMIQLLFQQRVLWSRGHKLEKNESITERKPFWKICSQIAHARACAHVTQASLSQRFVRGKGFI